MNCGSIQLSVQRQLKENWDDREYIQLISDHIKNTADFLTKFEVSVKSKLAKLDDTITCLERRLDYLEALVCFFLSRLAFSWRNPAVKMAGSASHITKMATEAVSPYVAPIVSSSKTEARFRVLAVYKELQRLAPKFWHDYDLKDISLPVFRAVLKNQFTRNSHLNDVRVIDRQVDETKQHIYSIHYNFYNKDHVRNFLFRENVEPKPKDFLSRFLSQKE